MTFTPIRIIDQNSIGKVEIEVFGFDSASTTWAAAQFKFFPFKALHASGSSCGCLYFEEALLFPNRLLADPLFLARSERGDGERGDEGRTPGPAPVLFFLCCAMDLRWTAFSVA